MREVPLLRMVLEEDYSGLADLLGRGADVNVRGPLGMTALMVARDERIVTVLLEHGADVEAVDDGGATALMYQAELGNLEAVRELLNAGADPNGKDHSGRTALDRAKSRKLSHVSVGRDGRLTQHVFSLPRRGSSDLVKLLRQNLRRTR